MGDFVDVNINGWQGGPLWCRQLPPAGETRRRERRPTIIGQDARQSQQPWSGGAAAEYQNSCNGAARPQYRAGGSTPSLPPPPPPAGGSAPPRQGRCSPRLAPTPGGKRA